MLNGRSFPFTLRDTPIVVRPDETTKLRVLNVGAGTRYLHTHGHHPTLTHLDGYPVPKDMRITRDTFEVGPGQRVDLALRSGSDGTYAAGPGVWLLHDHTQPAASNKGIIRAATTPRSSMKISWARTGCRLILRPATPATRAMRTI